ncbi:E3 ubiquitin-protein ligase ZFP91 [Hoplias malabaricus]|uniref:E3 ubiquitin-protein ligase ZFP91 n=1 Tax=Hoplias malabaricus TaxID=27720 RepID=UPI0034629CFE
MDPQKGDVEPSDNNKEEKCGVEEKASDVSPTHGESYTPRKTPRGRGAARLKARDSKDTTANGSGENAPVSGRVLRDRSARAPPAWRNSDEAEEKDTEVVEDSRRRKAAPSRRNRASEPGRESGPGPSPRSGESKDAASSARASSGRRTQSRGRTPSARKSLPRVVCKSEPGTETSCAEAEEAVKTTGGSAEKKEEEEDDGVSEEAFLDDPKNQSYRPQSHSDEEVISSDEDVPFRDDLNDQSYDPKSERDAPKPRRKAPPKPREKKEKASVVEKKRDAQAEVKKEGGDGVDVKLETSEGAEPPRKRGRRRKDDKSPRLPKRRKKPPVQYVRCEMEGCGTVLAHPRYLQHHIKYQHLMKKKYVCPHPTCGRLFRLQKQLLRHAKHHTDQRDYICEFCARAFKSSHNLAVHRMIHTGEKPLQCEICGFTCRQKASLNWHMKKHDADASYQFSCSICGKKFEKKDSVVAHKAKSHPEVLIAEALAANAGALITTPGALMESSTGPLRTEQVQEVTVGSGPVAVGSVQVPVSQVSHVGPVVVVEPEHSLRNMQVPLTLSLPTAEEALNRGTTSSHAASAHGMQAVPLHFVPSVSQQQQQQPQPQIQQLPLQHSSSIAQQASVVHSYPSQPQILQMTFRAIPQHQQQQMQQLPMISVAQQLPQQSQALIRAPNLSPTAQTLSFSTEVPPPSSSAPSLPQAPKEEAVWDGNGPGENGNVGGVWEGGGGTRDHVLTDSSDAQIQHGLM